jgi:uncharacterized protein (TIGR03435 family)
MRRAIIGSGIFSLLSIVAFGQTADSKLTFEVASVKRDAPDTPTIGTQGGPGTRDPERFSGRGTTLVIYLCMAYFAPGNCHISGPKWIGALGVPDSRDTEKYDIEVKIPPGTTKEQYQKMFQNLLTERFHLVLHHETRVLPVYELVVAKDGPKFKESVPNESAPAPGGDPPAPRPPGKPEMDKDGFPVLPPGVPGFTASHGPGALSHWTAQQQPISVLARSLSAQTAADRPVIDKTGLTGKYDFHLAYDMHLPGMTPGPDDAPGMILFDAVQKQLGLKLVDAKAPFDFVIIDRGDKTPTEN